MSSEPLGAVTRGDRMARFFFDFTDGVYSTTDNEGHELDGIGAVSIEATRALAEVLITDPRDGNDREMTCAVREEHGGVVYRASITLKGQNPPHPSIVLVPTRPRYGTALSASAPSLP